MKKTMLLFVLACGLSPRLQAQVNTDPCQQVRAEDVVTLITLNQAEVTTNHDLGSNRCSFEVQNSIDTIGSRLDLTITKFDSHAAAVAYMKNEFPFYFDKQPPLVKTSDSNDHVDTVLTTPTAATAEAVHENYMSRIDINSIESGARTHPTFEYRLQRLALQATGATILPTAGLPPDPVSPKRELTPASSPDARSTMFGWLSSGKPVVTALTLLGPLITLIVLYRVLLAPRLRRKRLLAAGQPGTALIQNVRNTGVTVNNSPQVLFDCLVTPANGSGPYRASTKALLSQLDTPASHLDSTVNVRIDPANPQVFIIV
jgi:hypothetical protein